MKVLLTLSFIILIYGQNISTFNASSYSEMDYSGKINSFWFNPLQDSGENDEIFVSYSSFNHGSDFSDYFIGYAGKLRNNLHIFAGYRQNKVDNSEYVLIKESWIKTNLNYHLNHFSLAFSYNYFNKNWDIIDYIESSQRFDIAFSYNINKISLSVIHENLSGQEEFKTGYIFTVQYKLPNSAVYYIYEENQEIGFEYSFSQEFNTYLKISDVSENFNYNFGLGLNFEPVSFAYFYQIMGNKFLENSHQLIISTGF